MPEKMTIGAARIPAAAAGAARRTPLGMLPVYMARDLFEQRPVAAESLRVAGRGRAQNVEISPDRRPGSTFWAYSAHNVETGPSGCGISTF
jgi:hypothetical protein